MTGMCSSRSTDGRSADRKNEHPGREPKDDPWSQARWEGADLATLLGEQSSRRGRLVCAFRGQGNLRRRHVQGLNTRRRVALASAWGVCLVLALAGEPNRGRRGRRDLCLAGLVVDRQRDGCGGKLELERGGLQRRALVILQWGPLVAMVWALVSYRWVDRC